jgi:dUTP pyrophosphatase
MEAWNPLAGLATVNVDWKKLHPAAQAPAYGSDEAAGADLHSVEFARVQAGNSLMIPTGIAIELPRGFEAQVRPRSGLAANHKITVLNTPGTIDSDYRGEIKVILMNHGLEDFDIKPGDRIAQLVIVPVFRARFFATGGVLSETARGAGGFGSTGV